GWPRVSRPDRHPPADGGAALGEPVKDAGLAPDAVALRSQPLRPISAMGRLRQDGTDTDDHGSPGQTPAHSPGHCRLLMGLHDDTMRQPTLTIAGVVCRAPGTTCLPTGTSRLPRGMSGAALAPRIAG